MCDINKVQEDIKLARRELKNIRQESLKQKASLAAEISKIHDLIYKATSRDKAVCYGGNAANDRGNEKYSVTPIGFISSCFKNKNGIPRQPSLCPAAKGTLEIEKSVFTNPEHSLIGLSEFSHIWILFIFHENGTHSSVKAKVHPPRLNGSSVGVFSTRSPHRPSEIGLSLIRLERIEGNKLFLSGIDLLDGTPVIDIKPYIPLYDVPHSKKEINSSETSEVGQNRNVQDTTSASVSNHELTEKLHNVNSPTRMELIETKPRTVQTVDCNVASHVKTQPHSLSVVFTNRALSDLDAFHAQSSHAENCKNCLLVGNEREAKQAIIDVLKNDPRSVYRRQKCSDRLYYFSMSNMHITCWFEDDIAEVLRIKPESTVNNEGTILI